MSQRAKVKLHAPICILMWGMTVFLWIGFMKAVTLAEETSVWIQEEGIRLQPSDFGIEPGEVVADATVAQLPNDQLRLYVFVGSQGIRSAISSDGLTFTIEDGIRLPEGFAGQPRVVPLTEGGWRMFFTTAGGIGSAVSEDGLNFTEESGLRISPEDTGMSATSSPTIVTLPDGTYRMYFSDLPIPGEGPLPHYVLSATSTDMLSWTVEPGVRLGEGSELEDSAEHPFAVANADDSVTLFYFDNMLIELLTATSADGLTFSSAASTGIPGNDPDIVTLPDGQRRMYYGDFDPIIGGFILSALEVEALPDLTGDFIRIVHRNFGSQGLLGFALALQNNGTAATEAAFGVDLYLSDDTVFDSSDLFLTDFSVFDSLEPGGEVGQSGRLRISGSTSGQFVLAVVDADEEIVETNDENNVVVAEVP